MIYENIFHKIDSLKNNDYFNKFYYIKDGLNLKNNNIELQEEYLQYLLISNGGSFGIITLYDLQTALIKNVFINMLVEENFIVDKEEWIEIGKINDEYLLYNNKYNKVYLFSMYYYIDRKYILLDNSFFDFINNYVFGYKYHDILSYLNIDKDKDGWIPILNNLN